MPTKQTIPYSRPSFLHRTAGFLSSALQRWNVYTRSFFIWIPREPSSCSTTRWEHLLNYAPTDVSNGLDRKPASLFFSFRQIKGLDQELIKYRNALKKAKGPTAANIKRRAMETLKRKKMYEGQRDQMAGQQFNIEQTGFAIDSIKDTATTVR